MEVDSLISSIVDTVLGNYINYILLLFLYLMMLNLGHLIIHNDFIKLATLPCGPEILEI